MVKVSGRAVAVALCALGWLTPARASATCSGPDGCGFFHSFGGADVTVSSSRVDGRRTGTLYGISVGQRALALLRDRADHPHLLDFTIDFSIGAHGEGGPPGGALLLGGGYGTLLELGRSPVHGPFVKGGFLQDFHGDRAITHYRIALPSLAAGYAIHDRVAMMEISGRAGLELFASDTLELEHQSTESGDEDAWRHSHVAAPYLGAGARMMVRGLSFELAVQRAFPRDEPGARLDRVDSLLCATAWFVALCGRASYLRARSSDTEPEVRGVRVGLTAGVGFSGAPDDD